MFIFVYCICIEFLYVYFPVLLCLSVSVKSLAVKTASEMTCIVSRGALNSIHSPKLSVENRDWCSGNKTLITELISKQEVTVSSHQQLH